jgi:hypothetical protein
VSPLGKFSLFRNSGPSKPAAPAPTEPPVDPLAKAEASAIRQLLRQLSADLSSQGLVPPPLMLVTQPLMSLLTSASDSQVLAMADGAEEWSGKIRALRNIARERAAEQLTTAG